MNWWLAKPPYSSSNASLPGVHLNRKLSGVSVARATNAQAAVNKHAEYEAQVTEKFAYSPVEYTTELGFSAASSRDHWPPIQSCVMCAGASLKEVLGENPERLPRHTVRANLSKPQTEACRIIDPEVLAA